MLLRHRDTVAFCDNLNHKTIAFPFQAACTLECKVSHALSSQPKDDRCVPWYYPQARQDVRMCSPYEAREFDAKMEDDSANCTVNTYMQGDTPH